MIIKLGLSVIAGYILASILFPSRGFAKTKKPEVAEIYSPKTGVRKRIDPQLAHRIQGALDDPMNNCVCREQVYTGLNCPVIGQPCTHWDKDLPHKTAPLTTPSKREMEPWTRLSVA